MVKEWSQIVKFYVNSTPAENKKDIEVSKQFMAFWIALLIAPTFHVRIMFIPFCSLYIFGIN